MRGTFVDHAPATKSVVASTTFGSKCDGRCEGTGTTNGVPLAVNVMGIGAKPIVVPPLRVEAPAP